jgi:acetylornithine/succinyldiaminopimelate/putrescine aminotransferase
MGLLRRTQDADTARKDRKFLGRTGNAEDIDVVAAQGARIRDARGRSFIDFQMGWCVGNLGWNPPEILARIRNFEGPMYIAPGLHYAPWAELAELLVERAPGNLARAFRCVGGTEAVEHALQLAMTHTGRHKIVSLEGAYHGNSIAARAIGAGDAPAQLPGMKRLALPLDENALDRLETQLKHQDVAAFIMEPVVLNLSVIVPDSAFMAGLVELCHRYDTLVIMDEVGTGFGRCGRMYASELWKLEPDLMTLGKAIGSGVAPIAAVLATEEVAKTKLDFFSTFAWQPIAVEAAIATQLYWRDHRNALLSNIAERSAELRQKLSTIEWRKEPELRIQGLAIGVDLGDPEYASKIAEQSRDDGLLVFAEDESLVMFPPLILDQETLQEAVDILSDCAQS